MRSQASASMADKKVGKPINKPNEDQIAQCIDTLETLNAEIGLISEIEEEKRLALIKAAGLFSRPNRDEFSRRRKDAKKAAKRKIIERDKHARKETGIRSAREASIFVAPAMIALTGDEANKASKQVSSRSQIIRNNIFTALLVIFSLDT